MNGCRRTAGVAADITAEQKTKRVLWASDSLRSSWFYQRKHVGIGRFQESFARARIINTINNKFLTTNCCLTYLRKIAAIVCSAGAGVQAVLFTDYNIPGDDPHVFTELQAAFKELVRSKLHRDSAAKTTTTSASDNGDNARTTSEASSKESK